MMPGAITFTSHDTGLVPVAESAAPAAAAPPAPGHVTVSESYATTLNALIGGSPYDLFAGGDPVLMQRYGGFWAADRVQLPNHAPAGIYSEAQHRAAVSWSRWLCEKNHLARGFLNHVPAYIGAMTVQWARRGESPGAVSSGLEDRDGDGETDADPLVKRVQAVWDEWCEATDWGMGEEDREKECRVRYLRDGNLAVRLGCGGPERAGLPWVRFIEPEQIRYPSGPLPAVDGYDPDELDWSWGVCTLRRDAETVLGYWVARPDLGGAGGEFVPAAEVCRLKANVDRTIKVGVPDFYPLEQPLQEALGILANCAATAREQSSVAWIQKYATSTQDQVRTVLQQGAEAYARQGAGVPAAQAAGSAGNHFSVRTYGTTRVIHADGNREYEGGPASQGVPGYMQVVEGTMRGVGKTWGLENWFGSGGGSFAAELVEGGEFVTHVKDRQGQQIGFTKRVAVRVIELAERSGRLPAGTSNLVKPVVTAKPVVVADEEKQVRTWLSLYDKNLADPTDIIKKRGGDPRQVAANIIAWKKKFGDGGPGPGGPGPGGPGPGGPGPGGPPPTDPTATPPGSAGGDGSAPNAPPELAAEGAGGHRYGCVLAPLDGAARLRLLDLARLVRDEDLADRGREDEPHVTVRYGLAPEVTAERVLPIVRGSGPLALELGAVSAFAGAQFDVLKVDVEGAGLRALHAALGALPHTDAHDTYRPHATIAYVKPGLGAIYARLLPPVGLTAEASRVAFGAAGSGGRTAIPLDPHRAAESGSAPDPAPDELLAAALEIAEAAAARGESAEDAVAALFETAEPAREGFSGVVTDKLGRKFHYADGKRVAAPKGDPAPKPSRAALKQQRREQATEAAGKFLAQRKAGKPVTDAEARELAAHLGHLTHPELTALRKAHGATFGGETSKTGRVAELVKWAQNKSAERRRAQQGSALQQTVDYGGIDPNSADFKRFYGSLKDAVNDGIPLAAFKKGGMALDALAQQMVSSGHISPADHDDPSEHLIDLLRGRKMLRHSADDADRQEAEYQQYMRNRYGDEGDGSTGSFDGNRHIVWESLRGQHTGRTEDGFEWVSESAYALLSETGRAGLTLQTITDKNGKSVKRWVRSAAPTPPEADAKPHIKDVIAKSAKADAVMRAYEAASADLLAARAAEVDPRRKREASYWKLRDMADALEKEHGLRVMEREEDWADPRAAEWSQYRTQVHAPNAAAYRAAEDERRKKEAAVGEAIRGALKPPVPQKIAGAFTAAEHGAAAGSYPSGFQEITGPKVKEYAKAIYGPAVSFVESVATGIDGAKVAYGKSKDGRAWAAKKGVHYGAAGGPGADYIALIGETPPNEYSQKKESETAVHELGHVLEFHKPGVKQLALEFLEHRVGTEPPTKLKDVAPNANYRDGEVGRKDNFDRSFDEPSSAYYVGKSYGGSATEVVSMGLELLYKNPADFAASDPEYFRFVCHILTM